MKKFEYYVLAVPAGGLWGNKIDAQDLTDQLNELGEEGWELVSIVDENRREGGTKGLLATLKREIIP